MSRIRCGFCFSAGGAIEADSSTRWNLPRDVVTRRQRKSLQPPLVSRRQIATPNSGAQISRQRRKERRETGSNKQLKREFTETEKNSRSQMESSQAHVAGRFER